MRNSPVEKILDHIKAIEVNIDGLIYLPGIITRTLPKYSGQISNSGIITLNLNYEYETVDDYNGAAYILTSILSLSNYYVDQIDYHTKEICGILEGQVDQNIINELYSNLSGHFFLPDPELEENLYDASLTFLSNKEDRFKEIYSSSFYSPKGTKYLGAIWSIIINYWKVCEPIQSYLDDLKNSMQK